MTNPETHGESGLAQMDRRLRRLSVAVAVLAAGFVVAFATGATSSVSVPDFLVAKTFRLVDDDGSLRGVLATDAEGRVVLSVVSKDGKPGSRLVLDYREPRLAVYDATGTGIPITPAANSVEPAPSEASPAAALPNADAPAPAATEKKGIVRWGGAEEEDDDAFDWAD
jgi:hypothetical protein